MFPSQFVNKLIFENRKFQQTNFRWGGFILEGKVQKRNIEEWSECLELFNWAVHPCAKYSSLFCEMASVFPGSATSIGSQDPTGVSLFF